MAGRVKLLTLAVASGTASGVVADISAGADIRISREASSSQPPSSNPPPSNVRPAGPSLVQQSATSHTSILKHKALRSEKNAKRDNAKRDNANLSNEKRSNNAQEETQTDIAGPKLAAFEFGQDKEADELIKTYCNVEKDYGPIDPPVFNVTQAAVFIRHGARTMSGGIIIWTGVFGQAICRKLNLNPS
jgi:hypothetical protein